jgi:hypothetical protein
MAHDQLVPVHPLGDSVLLAGEQSLVDVVSGGLLVGELHLDEDPVDGLASDLIGDVTELSGVDLELAGVEDVLKEGGRGGKRGGKGVGPGYAAARLDVSRDE